MTNFVLQKNKDGLYCSELINDKYQVLESQFVRGNYYVYNLEKDCIEYRDADNSITLFSSVSKCLERLNNIKVTTKNNSGIKKISRNYKETAFSYMRTLLYTYNTKTDEEIVDLIKNKYPDSKYSKYFVKYQRKLLINT